MQSEEHSNLQDSEGSSPLGEKELAVDGVVIVAEHGNYRTDLKGRWLLPRWWIYHQVIQVFEQSKRSVPVFNDKHLSYSWDEAKWMFDTSRELNFPLTGGSSIPTYFRKPEIELAIDTPIKNSIVVGDTADEGAIFHCIDVLQAFVDRRKGGERGVKVVQSIRGPGACPTSAFCAAVPADTTGLAGTNMFNRKPDGILRNSIAGVSDDGSGQSHHSRLLAHVEQRRLPTIHPGSLLRHIGGTTPIVSGKM